MAEGAKQARGAPTSASSVDQTGPQVAYEERVASQVMADAGSTSTENLGNYAMQSPQGRMDALNDFMMQNIDDESFVTLCEDVEKCWTRIAMGLD